MFTTTLYVPGIGNVTVETVDFTQPGYELCGFETTTTYEDGDYVGIGPDNGETPAELHDIAVESLRRFIDQGVSEA